jgi:hypothetical protein
MKDIKISEKKFHRADTGNVIKYNSVLKVR